MSDEPDPPRKFYQLKSREFEVVNNLPAGIPAPGEEASMARDPGPSAVSDRRIELGDIIRDAATPGPALTRSRSVVENDVHDILRENHAHAEAAGLNKLAPKPERKSRRKRDYWVVMVLVNAGFTSFAISHGPRDAVVFVYCIAGMGFFTAGFSWIMWQVLDDY